MTTKTTSRTFKAIKAKAMSFGYPEELIEVEKDEVRFYFQNKADKYDYHETLELCEDVLSRIAEFFVGYDIAVVNNVGNNIVIKKSCGNCIDLKGFGDPMHY
jgi:hypothetical protein